MKREDSNQEMTPFEEAAIEATLAPSKIKASFIDDPVERLIAFSAIFVYQQQLQQMARAKNKKIIDQT